LIKIFETLSIGMIDFEKGVMLWIWTLGHIKPWTHMDLQSRDPNITNTWPHVIKNCTWSERLPHLSREPRMMAHQRMTSFPTIIKEALCASPLHGYVMVLSMMRACVLDCALHHAVGYHIVLCWGCNSWLWETNTWDIKAYFPQK
jgi:hypothetical protein